MNAKRLVIFCVGFWGRQPHLEEPLCFLHEVKPQEGVPPEKIEEIAVLWLELPIAIRVLIVCVLLRNAQSGGCPTRVCEGSNGSTGYRPCCALPSSCLWGGLLDCCSSNTQSQSGFVDLFGEASMITAARGHPSKACHYTIEDEKNDPHDAGEENDESESPTDDKNVD